MLKALLAALTLSLLLAFGLTGCGGGGSTPGTPEGTEYGIAVLNTDFSNPSMQPVIYDGVWHAPMGRLSFTLRVTGYRGGPAFSPCDFELLKSDDPMWSSSSTAEYKRITLIKADEVPEYTFTAWGNYKVRALNAGTTREIAHTYLQVDENWQAPATPPLTVTGGTLTLDGGPTLNFVIKNESQGSLEGVTLKLFIDENQTEAWFTLETTYKEFVNQIDTNPAIYQAWDFGNEVRVTTTGGILEDFSINLAGGTFTLPTLSVGETAYIKIRLQTGRSRH